MFEKQVEIRLCGVLQVMIRDLDYFLGAMVSFGRVLSWRVKQFICLKYFDCFVENGLWVGLEVVVIVQMRRMVFFLDWSGVIVVGMVRNDLGYVEFKFIGVVVVLRVVRERR